MLVNGVASDPMSVAAAADACKSVESCSSYAGSSQLPQVNDVSCHPVLLMRTQTQSTCLNPSSYPAFSYAQVNDVPFDPVFLDEDGNWTAPLLHYKEKRAPWQAYIDRVHFKQPD